MNNFRPTERKFEDHIESHLNFLDYVSIHFDAYDRKLCLIRDQVISFIMKTQPEEWKRLTEIYGLETEDKTLSRISSEVSNRGIVDVLRNKVVDRGVYIALCYFEPNSDLNPEHSKLFQSNKLTVVRQLRYSPQNEKSIDMVLFLNGLPLVTMELKNQLTGQNFKHSENQYRNNRDPREALFKFKRCLVHFCVDNNNVSMTTQLSGSKTLFLPYNRDLKNPPVDDGYRTKYLWEDVLTPASILDIIENFAHVSREKEFFFNQNTKQIDTKTKENLIFPRYHQRYLILEFRKSLKNDGTGKNYLVQHTTGSGKSYSIGWLTHTLTSLYQFKGDKKRLFDTVIVVTDRTVLDDQLRNTIRALGKTDGVVSGVEHGSQELKAFLEKGKGIIVTTIQKFPFISDTISFLGNKTFAVIVDEAHSSQSGELSKELKKSLSKTDKTDEKEFDYEDWLRQEIQSRGKQKHISFFAFTGTPKAKTLELFGKKNSSGDFVPFHIYSMHQSIHEGFTLDVLQNYTTYKRYCKVRQIKNEDIEVPASKARQELIKYVDSHRLTIQNKANIILDHWIYKGSKEIQGRARGMIITRSRKNCVLYFKEINRQLEERGIDFRSLVGFSDEISVGGKKYTEIGLNKTVDHTGDIPLGLKNPKFRLLVVANKFNTGFDEPLIQSMYVDKKLGGVQCVQTLSRLNRTTSGKTQTFILDFVNEPEDIQKSFQRFYQSTILMGETDPNLLYDLKREIYDFHLYTNEDVERFCKIFFDPDRNEGLLHPILDGAVEKFKLIKDEEMRESFRSKIQSYIRMYGYLSQIISFADIELEKSFVFLKYLYKKLSKRESENFDISDAIDLDSLRIQKCHEWNHNLEPIDATLENPNFDDSEIIDPVYDRLSEIINQVNNAYGANLTDEDKVGFLKMYGRMANSPEIKKYMTGNSSDENKQIYFDKQLNDILIEYVNERVEFYKKMDENPSAKKMLFQLIYSDYAQSLDRSAIAAKSR